MIEGNKLVLGSDNGVLKIFQLSEVQGEAPTLLETQAVHGGKILTLNYDCGAKVLRTTGADSLAKAFTLNPVKEVKKYVYPQVNQVYVCDE